MEPRQQFRNTTPNVLGVNIFEPGTGKPTAIALMPDETVWMSEDEQRMTAQAPRDHRANPFVTGALVAVTDERPIGKNARPIAGILGGAVQGPVSPTLQQDPDAQSGEPVPDSIFEDTPEDRAARERAEAERQGRIGAVPARQVVEPEPGALGGDDTAPPPVGDEDAGPGDQLEGEDPGSEEAAGEETAAEGEETGAAIEPQGDPPEGEFAQHEEVGDPDAPSVAADQLANGNADAGEETAKATGPAPGSAAHARQQKRKNRGR